MQHQRAGNRFPLFVTGLLVLFLLKPTEVRSEPSVRFEDAGGGAVAMDAVPGSIVSLVPSVTEILFRIGAGEAVAGVTHHDIYPPEAATRPIVGGFFFPSVERIESLEPDLVFVSDLHQPIVDAWDGEDRPVFLRLPLDTLDDLYATIGRLGRLMAREAAATELAEEIRAELGHTARKVATVPASQRKRVLRFMGRDRVMTPGSDGFQNEMIRLAGGVPPDFDKRGKVVPVTLEEWQRFNPQVIYGCDGDRKAARTLLHRPGWRDVDAVRNGAIRYFPCDLTCRLSTRTGHFVSCLAAEIHADIFAQGPPVAADGVTGSRPVPLDLPYVEASEIVESTVNDYTHKTLLLHLATPMAVSSTLEGFRRNIRHVGNSYSPPQCWALYHRIGLETSRKQLLRAIGRDGADTSLLFTGADMDNLSVQRRRFKEMTVYALVTAGVRSNAVRMAEDVGAFYEPGTINMILLSNLRLTPRAMNRAIISATEAKTAALWDLDIRSAYTPSTNPATGTGTDNIIVVAGEGEPIDNAGGHSKMGELIARAVYAGVREAIFRQNGIPAGRNVFQRLRDRRISLFGLVSDCACGLEKTELTQGLERLLLDPRYAAFIEAALAVSDRYERGLVTDIGPFRSWCRRIAGDIAGQEIPSLQAFTFREPLPPVVEAAFEALLTGIAARTEPKAP